MIFFFGLFFFGLFIFSVFLTILPHNALSRKARSAGESLMCGLWAGISPPHCRRRANVSNFLRSKYGPLNVEVLLGLFHWDDS